jgi:succinyl-CoA synthetase beta subunit
MDVTGADKKYKAQLTDLVKKLYTMFFKYYTMLVEINPLGIDAEGNLTALDAKVEIDDNALPMLPDVAAWRNELQEDSAVLEARKFKFHMVQADEKGDIGVMSNGSGMLMSCIDLIDGKGISRTGASAPVSSMCVGACLDLGGGATADRIAEAVRIMFSVPRIKTVFICIFGGITRCDEVAKGAVIAMQKGAAKGKNMILRMEGTNKEAAAKIIADANLPIIVAEGIPNSVEAIYKVQKGGAQ